jgi:GTP-binding protein
MGGNVEKVGVPVVAIVGRPNVGKSTLFNALAGRRISIVEPTAGVTRDRVTTWIEIGDRTVELVDTGGMGVVDVEDIRGHVEQQIRLALEAADVVVFVVDVRDGVTPLDGEVAERLRRTGKPVILVANKADAAHFEPYAGEFYALGFGEPYPLSALEGFGTTDLRDRIRERLPPAPEQGPAADDVMKVAVVGKRNAGKSTFINALCREERMIVSDIPGTTRDAVDVRFERDGEVFVAIDTAGLRRKRSIENAIELFSQARTEEAIKRADVVIFVFDVTQEVSSVDKNLAHWIAENEKPCVLVGNKWDLARERILTGDFHEYLQRKLPRLQFSPIVFTTATQGKGVPQVLEVARDLYRQARVRVPTPELNRAIEDAMKVVAPRIGREGVKPKVYFAAQTGVAPPSIVIFTNKPALFDERYRRYLSNRIRERFDFPEVPLRLVFRERLTIYDLEERQEREERLRGKRRRRGRELDADVRAAREAAGGAPPAARDEEE